MSKAKHTPGPWSVRERSVNGETVDCFVTAPDVNGFPYGAEILGDDEYRDGIERKLADAHLIAAAPDLLEALERIEKTAAKFDSPDTRYYVKIARAAIAKAKGE